MLRRDFIKTGSICVGAMILLRNIPLADAEVHKLSGSARPARLLRHHGDPRCGCATPPEKQALMEWGLYGSLPD